ncbi:hypothetical protein AC628_22470, partial [Bradyrhizobium sp. NAS96.2]
ISQHRLRSAERPLCVDDPLRRAERRQKGCEALGIGEPAAERVVRATVSGKSYLKRDRYNFQ